MFQRVDVSDDILAEPKLRSAVESATQVLGEAIGHSASLISVRWDKVPGDLNRPIIRLVLEDWTGNVKAVFSPQELTDDDSLRARIYKVYGDLLQIRSHKQLDELLSGGTVGQGT
jgi:hypothetical protein